MVARCTATNKDGRPCSAQAWKGALCRWHHPDLEAERAEGRRRGGANKGNRARARREMADAALSLAELQGYVAVALWGVLAGRYTPGQATAVAALARAAVSVREVTELEERLAALEAAAAIERRMA